MDEKGREMKPNSVIRKYELMLIVDAKLTNEEKEVINKEVSDLLQKSGAKMINNQVWNEKHRFTFRIKKCTEGTYYLINFESDTQVANHFRSLLRLNEKILRFGIIQVN
jgi:small subunit ribosomal protein S6